MADHGAKKPEKWWWQAEPEPAAEPSSEALARHRAVQEQLLRFDQNAWLAKRAKQRRFQFSGDQKRMLRQWFDALDSDGSGRISVEELEDPMLSIGIVNDTREIREIVSTLDKDANGQIDFQEFVEFLTPHAKRKDARGPEKHEVMFHQLTEKMEHQSSGFLEINTQLSMERRRFILDSITKFTSQSIQDDLAELKRSKTSKHEACASQDPDAAMAPGPSRHKRVMSRKAKLAALATRHQEEMRFQALEQVFLRNSTLKRLQAMPASLLATPATTRRGHQHRMELLTPLSAASKPTLLPERSASIASPSQAITDASRRTTVKLLEQSGMSSYTRTSLAPTQARSVPNLPPNVDVGG